MAGAIEQKVEDHWSRFLKLQLNVGYLLWDNFCRRYCEWWSCQIQETGVNVRIYVTDNVVSSVDTRLRLPTETPSKGMQQECNFNFITNGWVKLATCGWAHHFCQDHCTPKQRLIILTLLYNSNFPCNVRAWMWNPSNDLALNINYKSF